MADRFRLERELGRGGMGCVWRAHHLALDVPCAVKFISEPTALGTIGVARFTHEARAAAKLRSANVVQMLDHGVWDGVPYIAMELLEGESLAARLERHGPLGLAATHAIVAEIARALSRAEELHIVHRDLKPENVFIVRDGDRETVKVLDFGIAKVDVEAADLAGGGAMPGDASPKTQTGAFVGTPQYMSPEQADGSKRVDHRSDLWALAVIAFECVTGQPPFGGKNVAQVLQAILAAPLPVPSVLVPALGAAFDAWWTRAAARDPSARFQSAREMADALGQVALATPERHEIASQRAREAGEQDTLTASQATEIDRGLPVPAPSAQPPAPPKAPPQTLSGQSVAVHVARRRFPPSSRSRAVQPPRSSRRGAILLAVAAGAAAALVIGVLATREAEREVTAASSSLAPPEVIPNPTETTAAPVEVKPAPEAPSTSSPSEEARAAPTARPRVAPAPVAKEPRAKSVPPVRGGAATAPTVKQLEPGY